MSVESIAAKLTAAQRRSLCRARLNSIGDLLLPSYRDAGRMRRSIEAVKLCNAYGRLNRRGQQVAAYLKEQGE